MTIPTTERPFEARLAAVTAPCGVEGCTWMVGPPGKCSEHGGQPQMQWQTDPWGVSTYRFEPEELE